jgi:glycine cleavage system H lipoate-binding protein
MVALFVLLTIVVFLLLDGIVLWARRHRGAESAAAVVRNPLEELLPEPEVPGGVFLSPSHLWVGLQSSGAARIGLDPLLRAALGPPDRVDVPPAGTRVRRGEPLFSARWGTRSILFHSPAEGMVQSPPPAAADEVEEGWVLNLQPAHANNDLKQLPLAEEARQWFSQEWARLRDFAAARSLQASPTMVLPDGGAPAPGWLALEPDDTWDRFVESFLGRDSGGH